MFYQPLVFLILIVSHYIQSKNNDKLALNNSTIPKISVIIPVYNMEKYLNECLDSVINQTLKNIEIICVNDGSIDNSLKILKEYERKDKRIKIINQENKGVAIARNNAIDMSKGEFISFLDSDDKIINNNSLENLYYAAVNNNVLISGGNSYSYHKRKKLKLDYFQKEGFVNYSDFQKPYNFCKYIYNTKFIKQNKIYFPNYTCFEDPIFFVKAMNEAKIFYALPQEVHFYRYTEKINKMTKEKIIDILKGMLDILKYSDKNNLNILYLDIVNKFNKPYSIKMFKKFKNNHEVKNHIIKILQYINFNKIKKKNKKFKLKKFYKNIMKKVKIKKNSDL